MPPPPPQPAAHRPGRIRTLRWPPAPPALRLARAPAAPAPRARRVHWQNPLLPPQATEPTPRCPSLRQLLRIALQPCSSTPILVDASSPALTTVRAFEEQLPLRAVSSSTGSSGPREHQATQRC